MFQTNWLRYILPGILVFFVMALLPDPAHSKSPVIIRHDVLIMETEVRLNIAWQSDEPIVKIIAAAGKVQVVVDNDIDNERNDGGYSGVMDIVIPYAPYSASSGETVITRGQRSQGSLEMSASATTANREMVQYTVQLIDEVNQRSTLLKDLVRRPDPAYALSRRKDPRPLQNSGGTVVIDTNNPINTAINAAASLIGKIGGAPEIKDVKVKTWTESRFSLAIQSTGDKGIDRVVFEIQNSSGEIVYQGSVYCETQKLCIKESEPFALTAGRYLMSAIASDSDAHNSKKYTFNFTVTGTAISGQQASQIIPLPSPPDTQVPATQSSTANNPVLNVPVQ